MAERWVAITKPAWGNVEPQIEIGSTWGEALSRIATRSTTMTGEVVDRTYLFRFSELYASRSELSFVRFRSQRGVICHTIVNSGRGSDYPAEGWVREYHILGDDVHFHKFIG